jgi:hypothetical protein
LRQALEFTIQSLIVAREYLIRRLATHGRFRPTLTLRISTRETFHSTLVRTIQTPCRAIACLESRIPALSLIVHALKSRRSIHACTFQSLQGARPGMARRNPGLEFLGQDSIGWTGRTGSRRQSIEFLNSKLVSSLRATSSRSPAVD